MCTEQPQSVLQEATAKKKKEFDFSMWSKRHVAFRIAYLGWDYHGLAIQESTQETIEAKLFECLLIAKLIEDTRSCHYSRCGRTDKGVSAFGQVVSLHVRSALLDGPGLIISDDCKAAERKGR
jgi:tRNA pseudouridine38/39 synthase